VILPVHARSTASVEPSTNWIRASRSSYPIVETGSGTLAGALRSSTINAAAWRRIGFGQPAIAIEVSPVEIDWLLPGEVPQHADHVEHVQSMTVDVEVARWSRLTHD
jgi:hypothetical protein